MEFILSFLATLSGQVSKLSAGPALILKKFSLKAKPQRRDAVLIDLNGRRSGLTAFLLNLFGMDPTTHLTVTPVEITMRSTSMFGMTMNVIPMKQVALVQASASSPVVFLILAIFAGLAGVPLLAVSTQAGAVPMGMAVVFILAFLLKGKTFTLAIQSTSGLAVGMSIKAKRVEGKMIDIETLQTMVTVIRELVVAEASGGAAPVAVPSGVGMSFDDEPGAGEVFEAQAIEVAEEPAPVKKSGGGSPFDFGSSEPAPVSDPEEEARQMFLQGADLFKSGDKREAMAVWERLAKMYPRTQAGQAAVRNLEKLRG